MVGRLNTAFPSERTAFYTRTCPDNQPYLRKLTHPKICIRICCQGEVGPSAGTEGFFAAIATDRLNQQTKPFTPTPRLRRACRLAPRATFPSQGRSYKLFTAKFTHLRRIRPRANAHSAPLEIGIARLISKSVFRLRFRHPTIPSSVQTRAYRCSHPLSRGLWVPPTVS